MTSRLLAAATLGCALTASLAAVAVPQEAQAAKSPWMVRGRLLALDEGASVSVLGGNLEIERIRQPCPSLGAALAKLRACANSVHG